ncbi:MAG: glycoside hydrolase [Bacteroidetes bacterium]|nr:glycoside hydrolase [Bacteroidota bacterium]
MLRIFLFLMFFSHWSEKAGAQNPVSTSKPWTYWWWMGSAVDTGNIKTQLDFFAKNGLGGVHIIPIYGAKGFESKFQPFMSENWLNMVQFTQEYASFLGLGVDITLGTGWPYGGPMINSTHAAAALEKVALNFSLSDSCYINLDSIQKKEFMLGVLGANAVNENGESIWFDFKNLTSQFVLSKGSWNVTIWGVKPTGQKVKRAAPGGEGLVADYFNEESIRHYLRYFDAVLLKHPEKISPRAYYHDSYEVFGADWTKNLSLVFEEKKGYSLLPYLNILKDTSHADFPYVMCDIREVLSDLLYESFGSIWTEWVKSKNSLSRLQAHGSPGNLLDLYALSDIPETESFGCSEFDIPGLACDEDFEESRFGRPNPLMLKMASSAANVKGKSLVSSETGTWLANHFKVNLSQLKPQVDELFVSGINHIFYHGTTYSPKEVPYPGWLFYASSNVGLQSHFKDEFHLLNKYIEIIQTELQGSKSDADVLLYFPIHDLWSKHTGSHLLQLDVHKYSKWFGQTPFGQTAKILWNNSISFDYISDKQLKELKIGEKGRLYNDHLSVSALVIPATTYISESTFQYLQELSKAGANILFVDQLPEKFSGLSAKGRSIVSKNISFKISSSLISDLNKILSVHETWKLYGLDFIRKKTSKGYFYFLVNQGSKVVNQMISPGIISPNYEWMDPLTGERGRILSDGKIRVNLAPGKSMILYTYFTGATIDEWKVNTEGRKVEIGKDWEVSFQGLFERTDIPSKKADTLQSWTNWGSNELASFCGKGSYKTTFSLDKVPKHHKYVVLKFDQVKETAAVTINGFYCGTAWSFPFEVRIPVQILKKRNNIEIVVQNSAANLMRKRDSEPPEWKTFYDINIVDIRYQPFNAKKWDLTPSGLIGKVYLVIPVESKGLPKQKEIKL